MSKLGATPALRGYRLQFLYILNELLIADDEDLSFAPEDEEDLSIFKGGKRIRIIQVKAYSDSLTLSRLAKTEESRVSRKKNDSFFSRVSKYLKNKSSGLPKIEIASFGEIGPELDAAWNGDVRESNEVKQAQKNVLQKLKSNYKLSLDPEIFSVVTIKRYIEAELEQQCHKVLRDSIVAGYEDHAFELLSHWVFKASENQQRIAITQIRERLINIGKYFREREAYHDEWFKTIVPLSDEPNENVDEQLARQFYQGISTRYSHIKANLDVVREEMLKELDALFNESKICIVHAASGQGKTTFALRYLHNYASKYWCFHIKHIEDRTHAVSVANAVASHLKSLDVEAFLYIDVSPRDSDWPDLIKALLDIKNIKVLVTIREEDLARITVGKEELGNPGALSVNLNELEACLVYEQLQIKNVKTSIFPSPSIAWKSFGGTGPLLEFVYFLTQTGSLREKLLAQVRRLESDEAKFQLEPGSVNLLYICALATSFESRIKTEKLIQTLGLQSPRTIQLLENEYLFRNTDKGYIEAIHPIRSQILVELLEDPDFRPWVNAAKNSLLSLQEEDLEPFLLNSFLDKPNESKELIPYLNELSYSSWAGVYSVSKALLWMGLYQFYLNQKETIENVVEELGVNASALVLLIDFANAFGEDKDILAEPLSLIGRENPEKLHRFLSIRKRVIQASPQVFSFLKSYLTRAVFPIANPQNELEWIGFGRTLIWIDYLQLSSSVEINICTNFDIFEQFNRVEVLAEFTQGLYAFDSDKYQNFMEPNRCSIIELFQKETRTLLIELKENNPIAHYLIEFDEEGNVSGSDLNELSVRRAQYLRMLFPDNQKFGAVGHGHISNLMDLPFDEAEKLGMLKKAFPPDQFIELNSWWRNLLGYHSRPEDWKSFVVESIELREKFVAAIVKAKAVLNTYFRAKKQINLIINLTDQKEWQGLFGEHVNPPKLPKSATDPWGFSSESNAKNNNYEPHANQTEEQIKNENRRRYSISIQQYADYFLAIGDYKASITNFFQQSINVLAVNNTLRKADKEAHPLLIAKAEELGIKGLDHLQHLSTRNLFDAKNQLSKMQKEFRLQFQSICDINRLNELESKESSALERLWPLWFQFAHNPNKAFTASSPAKKSEAIYKQVQNDTKKLLIDSLTQLAKAPEYKQIKLLPKITNFENKQTCWIQVDMEDPIVFLSAFKDIIGQLNATLCPLEPSSIKYYALSEMWHQFAIIPTYKNQPITGAAWVKNINSFLGHEINIQDLQSWECIPRHLTNELQEDINLSLSKSNTLMLQFVNFRGSIEKLISIVGYLSNFASIAAQIDAIGKEILVNHAEKYTKIVIDNVKLVSESLEKLKCHPTLSDHQEFFDTFLDNVFPFKGENDTSPTLTFELFESWRDLLISLSDLLLHIVLKQWKSE